MKKVILLVAIAMTVTIGYGQKSIDALFQKYADKDGFTTVTINGNLLKLASLFGGNESDDSLPGDVSLIRILTQEDKNVNSDNVYDMVIGGIDLSQYEEFMSVKESGQDLKMYVRADGDLFKEFLLIGGGDDNVLIQIKGSMSLEDAKKFSGDAKKNQDTGIVPKSN